MTSQSISLLKRSNPETNSNYNNSSKKSKPNKSKAELIFDQIQKKLDEDNELKKRDCSLKSVHPLNLNKKELSKIYKNLEEEFKKLELISTSIGSNKTNSLKNRSHCITPFNHSLVQLNDSGYINASLICFNTFRVIAAQAPMSNSHSTFLQMLREHKIQTLVTLVMPKENGKERCFDYWSEIQFNAVEIKNSSSSTESIVQRQLNIPSTNNQEPSQSVTQFHYQHWQDRKAPNMELFTTLVKLLEKREEESPTVVHCSGGIGRTGVLITILRVLHFLKKEVKLGTPLDEVSFNMPKLILALRFQRHRKMVQTQEQLQFIVQWIQSYFKEVKDI